MPRPVTATIDLAALRHNLAAARSHAPRSSIFAVIKANAYGHGLMRAARAFDAAEGFALLELDAAIRLRETGYKQRILLLEGFFGMDEVSLVARHHLTPVIHHPDQIRMLAAAPRDSRIDVFLKLNTGMNRLGFAAAEFGGAFAALERNPRVRGITLMTHFADADGARGVDWQLERLEQVAGAIRRPRSLANSAALLRYPQTHHEWVRPGIMLYGATPFPDVPAADIGLRPAMTLTSEVIAVQALAAGERIGYGGAFEATAPVRAGIVACGYADGYPRHAPSGTPALVDGQRTRLIGRVSMDMLAVDLSGLPQAGIGASVTLWGAGLPVDEVAAAAGTVGYELLCALAPRVPVVERDVGSERK
ncbi:MAG TPA: alanine racemase [Burkholderiales bacterium]|nr:alanine racemase [Burkholderiales bacterium]